ncbi:WGxxGxxG family protein [Amycolatopsis sp. CA-128772]|uniref:WGxxGxxG family protein n=1 Tax=Amycolatopsis sp. CA-128772 TaxID=2073159 RepID=UPI000CD31EB6|nr:WGxxGxxG family protein [Amycolatopsis sp. CA-128772]
MTRTARKLFCGGVVAAAIALTGALPASAAPEFAAPAWHAQTDDGNARDNNHDDNDDNGLWGLLGLVGLLGLAGLVRRGPKPGAMAGYPVAGEAPPANTYPPAEPRRNPPGV